MAKADVIHIYSPSKKYSTSTGKGHQFIPQIPQDFDCRAKAHIKPEAAYIDISIRNEQSKTSYSKDFSLKGAVSEKLQKSPQISNLQYLKTAEEKFIVSPPIYTTDVKTEMKDMYIPPQHNIIEEEVSPVTETSKCYTLKLGSEQQPRIPTNQKGFWKWCDPYLTTYKANFLNNDKTNEKILTFYNKNDYSFPAKSGNKTMFDKTVFSDMLPLRQMSRPPARVPNLGMQSEYQNTYIKQSVSDLSPYLQDSGAEFDDSLAPASRWQNLAPPGMYCSEYCTIGQGSVLRVINHASEKRKTARPEN